MGGGKAYTSRPIINQENTCKPIWWRNLLDSVFPGDFSVCKIDKTKEHSIYQWVMVQPSLTHSVFQVGYTVLMWIEREEQPTLQSLGQ